LPAAAYALRGCRGAFDEEMGFETRGGDYSAFVSCAVTHRNSGELHDACSRQWILGWIHFQRADPSARCLLHREAVKGWVSDQNRRTATFRTSSTSFAICSLLRLKANFPLWYLQQNMDQMRVSKRAWRQLKRHEWRYESALSLINSPNAITSRTQPQRSLIAIFHFTVLQVDNLPPTRHESL
jgi:hypothetical protein